MTKAKISEYDAVASNNTDVNGVNIAEGCPPSGMNNMGREIMAALKRFQTGADGDSVTVGGSLVVSNTLTAGPVSATTLNTSGAVVFNDAGADVDFRVEGDTDANLLFVDAGNDRIGVKTSSPAVAFDVVGQVRASTGILFGTDTAAANALDDYEEGTFTPTVSDASSGGNNASGYGEIREGRYVKIGSRVFIWIAVAKNGSVGMTGANGAYITGLPFTNRSITGGWYTPLVCGFYNITLPTGNGFFGNVLSNTTAVVIRSNVSSGTPGSLTVSQWGDGVANTVIVSGFYEVA